MRKITTVLGLPDSIHGLLFDMDGVLTQTAVVHAEAWKQAFDTFMKRWSEEKGTEFTAFDKDKDYDEYVDGKPRLDGVRSFLESRDIKLPEGAADDASDAETVNGVGNAKNEILLKLIKQDGVKPYEGSVRYVHAALEQGLRCAVVSSSTNTHDILAAAGLGDLFEKVIDGNVVSHDHLHGKPAPDSYLAGAEAISVDPAHAAVFEDALSGVEAGRNGNFGYVVGVDRVGQADALREHGASTVVTDLAELLAA
jgi:beta-phosphoglucomutase family hydrolase